MIPMLLASAPAPPKPHVLIFVLEECPIARKYAPEIKRIAGDYRGRAIFTLVHEDPSTDAARAEQFAKEFGYDIPFKLDRDEKLAKAARVAAVPSAAVYVGAKLVYAGRIDDRFPALGVDRLKPKRHDLRIALNEVLAGKKVSVERTKPVGCAIPTL